MRLISYRSEGAAPRLGVVVGDVFVPATRLHGGLTTMQALVDAPELLQEFDESAVHEAIAAHGGPIDSVQVLAPVGRPGKVVCVGRNYPDHVAEESVDPPGEPILFSKWPSNIVGPDDPITWDPSLATQVDYEAELAAVIGWTARNVDVDQALDHVLGYTCLNDVSARDLQFGDVQWLRGKSMDTFCPMGPVLVTADEVADVQDLAIQCRVNDELMQDANTSEMFFSVAEIISFISRAFTLEPGDVIATGTPGGVGIFRPEPRLLTDGDVVTVEIAGIGTLTNPCRFSPPVR